MELGKFFNPKTVAVIGASRKPEKVGHVLFQNLLDSEVKRNIIPINPKAESILGKKAYKDIKDVNAKVDLAIIAIPAQFVLPVISDCNKKGIKNVLIVTSGFSETGDKKAEEILRDTLKKHDMKAIGVNCLGIYDAYSNLNALFIPKKRMELPDKGGISFVCQSGAIGLAIIDLAAAKGYKFSKFVSYGNATQLDESDYLEYLAKDKTTKVICMYVEGVKNGEKFFRTAKKVSKIKPIVIVKGGLSKEGKQATLSHTGSLAGTKETYFGIFSQTNIIRADNLEEMFHIASVLENPIKVKGNRVMIITNGGGYGIVSTDNVADSKNLKFAELSKTSQSALRKAMPNYVNIRNPLDISGDATSERYQKALEYALPDPNVDMIILVALYQTPLIKENITKIIIDAKKKTTKPILVVSTGSGFTEHLSDQLEKQNIPVFDFPHSAILALDRIIGYQEKLQR